MDLMKIVYQIILAVISVLLIWDMFTQKDIKTQIMAAITNRGVYIPEPLFTRSLGDLDLGVWDW